MDRKLELVAVPVSDVDRAKKLFSNPEGSARSVQQLPAR